MFVVGDQVSTISGDRGVIQKSRECPVLLRPEHLVSFQNGERGWVPEKFLLKTIAEIKKGETNESQT